MFSGGFRGQKLKTSLRLSIQKLKLMQKKKTEMALKSRKDIADIIRLNKYDRARIRVEQIIREDYLVEAMEIVEMYCDLLLARFGLIESKKYCDDALTEAVVSVIWAYPRISADCPELKKVCEQFVYKYGKEFGTQARSNFNCTVDGSLIFKLSADPPPKILVEKYLIEIARNFSVPFQPDQNVLMNEGGPKFDPNDFPPSPNGGSSPGSGGGQSLMYISHALPPYPGKKLDYIGNSQLPPYPGGPHQGKFIQPGTITTTSSNISNLPSIPSSGMIYCDHKGGGSKSNDIDELTKRFNELKKR